MCIRDRCLVLMDTNVPSQLDEADLSAELELEIPDSQEAPLVFDSDIAIEIVEEDDGSVLVDFDPSEDMADVGFDENLAEVMDDRELGSIASELMGEFDANKAISSEGSKSTRTLPSSSSTISIAMSESKTKRASWESGISSSNLSLIHI